MNAATSWSGPWNTGALSLVVLMTVGGFVLVPRAVVCVGAGAVLGWNAIWPTMLGSGLGVLLAFVLARSLLRTRLRRFVERRPRADAVMQAIDAEGWRLVALLRLASPVPGPLLNLASGLGRIRPGPYMAASVLGLLPQTVLFVALGRTGRAASSRLSLTDVGLWITVLGLVIALVAFARVGVLARRKLSEAAVVGLAPPA